MKWNEINIMLCWLSNFVFNLAFSQNPIMIHQGEIEYEKRINAYAILDEYYSNNTSSGAQQYAQQYRTGHSQFGVTTYRLIFNDEYSLYSPTPNTSNLAERPLLTVLNSVYLNLKSHLVTAKKNIFGEVFLVNDTIRKINWKITGESKEIAGFNCRRANGIIMDSIYVVAFYTDQIVPKGGPESFTGLPGMILGIALPHEHITWFATRISLTRTANDLLRPKGGKEVNYHQLFQLLSDDPSLKLDPIIGNLFLRNSLF